MLARSILSIPTQIPARSQLRPSIVIPSLSCLKLPWRSRLESTLPNLPIFRALDQHDPQQTAVLHSASGRSFTYGNLIGDVLCAQDRLERTALSHLARENLRGKPVAFLAENSYDYVGTVISFVSSIMAVPPS